jgi:hypothetical protein
LKTPALFASSTDDEYTEARELEDMGVTAATIYYHTQRARDWRWKMTERQGRSAPRKVILIADLPRDLQLKLAKRNEPSQPTEERPSRSVESLTQALLRKPVEERTAWQAELAKLAALVERYEAISPKRVRDTAGKYEPSAAVIAICTEAACTDVVILKREPSRATPPSPKTLDAWLARYRAQGLIAFLRSTAKADRSDDKRKATMSPEALEWVNKHWRNYRGANHLYKELEDLAKRKGWTIPAIDWIRRRWKELPEIVRTSLLQGKAAYTSKWASYVPRTVADLEALQILCGDHSQRDVFVLLRDGKTLARPWLTLWQCMRTSLLWGWHLDLTPSSYTIGAAYANGVKSFGAQPLSRPDEGFYSYLYTDQGRDYRSHHIKGSITIDKAGAAFTTIRMQREVGLLNELGIKRILARGYNAREKPIERVHRDISDWEENLFEEWCGRDAKFKPERYREMYEQHQRFLKGKRDGSPFIGIDEYRDALAGWIREYNARPHTRTTLNNACIVPLEEYRRLYTTHYSIAEEALALLLLKVAEPNREIRKNGVELFNFHYLHPEMGKWKGHKVEVRYDDADYSSVWVVLPDGKICQAEMLERSGVIKTNKDTVTRVHKQQAYDRRIIKEHNLLNIGMIRGETAADRVAAQLAAEQEDEVIEAIAAEGGGGGASVHKLTRFDRPKLRAVSAAAIDSAIEFDDSIFEVDDAPRGRVREFDYED